MRSREREMICLKNTFVVVASWIKLFAKVLLEDRAKVCLQGGKWGIIDLLSRSNSIILWTW